MSGLDRRRGPYLTVVKDGGRPLLGDGSKIWEPEPAEAEEHHQDSPERRLLAAVLEQAIRDYRKPEEDARGAHVWMPAKRWLALEELRWPGGFAAICQTLGLEADWIRQHLGIAVRTHWHLHAIPPRQSRPQIRKP